MLGTSGFKTLAPKNIFYIVLIVVGCIGLYRPPVDPDFGWHYKYGEYAVKNQTLLKENTFTYTLSEYNWVNSYWLFEIILYLSHYNLGNIAASVLFSLILSVALLLFLKEFSKDIGTISVVFLTTIFLFNLYYLSVRPHFFSTIFIFLLVFSLYNNKYKTVLPFIFLFWANIHAEFVIGLFVLGTYTLVEIVANFKTRNLKNSRVSVLICVLSFLASLINPNHITLWVAMFKEMVQPINSLVGEWQSPLTKSQKTLEGSLLFYILIVGGLIHTSKDNVNGRLWQKITALILVVFALRSAYMLRVAYILALPSIVQFIEKKLYETQRTLYIVKWAAAALMFIHILHGVNLFRISKTTKEWSLAFGLPYNEIQLLKETKMQGNIFNYYGWGGHLIWQLPENKIFIDGRMTGWKENDVYFMRTYNKIRGNPSHNEELLKETFEKYHIKYVLDQPNSPLVVYLLNKGAKVSYRSPRSILVEI